MIIQLILFIIIEIVGAVCLFLLWERRGDAPNIKLSIFGVTLNTFRWSLFLCPLGCLWLAILLTYPMMSIPTAIGVCVVFICASVIAFFGQRGEIIEMDYSTGEVIVGWRIASDEHTIIDTGIASEDNTSNTDGETS